MGDENRLTITITAATQTVLVDSTRRGNGLWHLRPILKGGEDIGNNVDE
jgi:hypothetical protein